MNNTTSLELSELLARLAEIGPVKFQLHNEPEAFEAAKENLKKVALAVDAYIHAIGRLVNTNAQRHVDMAEFTRVLTDALDGNATYEIDLAMEAEEEATASVRRYDDYADLASSH